MMAFVGGLVLGSIGAGLGVALVASGKIRESAGPTYLLLIANTRTDDGARLLGAIEDELEEARYGIGSGWRPEITFEEAAP